MQVGYFVVLGEGRRERELKGREGGEGTAAALLRFFISPSLANCSLFSQICCPKNSSNCGAPYCQVVSKEEKRKAEEEAAHFPRECVLPSKAVEMWA